MKYFTPELEDLHLGYECEFSESEEFEFELTNLDADELNFLTKHLYERGELEGLPDYIRVPYLTKEQIESEGWVFSKEINDGYIFNNLEKNYMMGYNVNTKEITILTRDPSHKHYYAQSSFKGNCKCINEFRKIIKLLGI
jgi:hypothetical protein